MEDFRWDGDDLVFHETKLARLEQKPYSLLVNRLFNQLRDIVSILPVHTTSFRLPRAY